MTDFDLDDIWKVAENELSDYNEKTCDSTKNCGCKHEFSNNTCVICGYIDYICQTAEWNNYRDQSTGEFSKNTQRADLYVDDNPYSSVGTIIPFNNRSLIGRLQIQQTFNHKQKTYWQTGVTIERVGTLLNLNKDIIGSAKNNWHIYMNSGKLTRASVRQGLIAACLFHSCVSNNVPIQRDEILKAFECSTKTLSKGEKVLYEILNTNNNVIITGIEIESSNSFIRYCNQLGLHFSTNVMCNDLYLKHKVQLQAVTPKSAIGGIISYIVKHVLKQKNPSKATISATVDICTPTLNKVIKLIETIEGTN